MNNADIGYVWERHNDFLLLIGKRVNHALRSSISSQKVLLLFLNIDAMQQPDEGDRWKHSAVFLYYNSYVCLQANLWHQFDFPLNNAVTATLTSSLLLRFMNCW